MNEHDVLTLLFATLGGMLMYVIPERFLPQRWYPVAGFGWIALFILAYAMIPEPWFRIDPWVAVLVLGALLALLVVLRRYRRFVLFVGTTGLPTTHASSQSVGDRVIVGLIAGMLATLFVMAFQHMVGPAIDWALRPFDGTEYVVPQ